MVLLDAFQFLDSGFAPRSSVAGWPSRAVSLQLSFVSSQILLGNGGLHVRRVPDGTQFSWTSGNTNEYLLEIWCTPGVEGHTSRQEYKVRIVPTSAASFLEIQDQDRGQRKGLCFVATARTSTRMSQESRVERCAKTVVCPTVTAHWQGVVGDRCPSAPKQHL